MQQIDFDQVDDVYKASPGWWGIIVSQENINCEQKDLLFEVQSQCLDLNNLGIDFLAQYDSETVSYDFLLDFLGTVNNKYISFLDYIRLDYDKLFIITKSIYEILFVDFIKETIPQICMVKKLDDPLKLIQANNEEFKTLLIEHYNNTLKQLNTLYKINNNLAGAMVKNSFALDLFDRDLEQFYEEFVCPVIINYQEQIRENYV
jgi:hypothetical protein